MLRARPFPVFDCGCHGYEYRGSPGMPDLSGKAVLLYFSTVLMYAMREYERF